MSQLGFELNKTVFKTQEKWEKEYEEQDGKGVQRGHHFHKHRQDLITSWPNIWKNSKTLLLNILCFLSHTIVARW